LQKHIQNKRDTNPQDIDVERIIEIPFEEKITKASYNKDI
jgi:hypothetical protein